MQVRATDTTRANAHQNLMRFERWGVDGFDPQIERSVNDDGAHKDVFLSKRFVEG
jgi:hypothetical protein